MKIYAGTSGYSYKEWKHGFYPHSLSEKEMLHYYAHQLPAVEINTTFYRLPRVETIEQWVAQVPQEFRFVIKASQRITHLKQISEDSKREVGLLFSALQALGQTFGAVLFQLPPQFRRDMPRLAHFLAFIPRGIRAAFEFRHSSWFDSDVFRLLAQCNCAWCVTETDKSDVRVVRTADWGYFRLRKKNYAENDLLAWAKKIKQQDWRLAFVFFKHENNEVQSPLLAKEFLNLFYTE